MFGALLVADLALRGAAYLWLPMDQLAWALEEDGFPLGTSRGQMALEIAADELVAVGISGLLGLWLARRLGLPGVFRHGAGWRERFTMPTLLGLWAGLAMVAVDLVPGRGRHPPVPLALVLSVASGIGEEVVCRMLVVGLFAYLSNRVLRRWGARRLALWIGNGAGALAFAAIHVPASAPGPLEAARISEIRPSTLIEIFAINGVLGLVAGDQYIRQGLVAAVVVHFWAAVVWNVIWPLTLSAAR